MKNINSKIAAILSTAIVCASSVATIGAYASNDTIDANNTNSIIDALDSAVEINGDSDVITYDESKIVDICNKFDLDTINAEYAKMGLDAITKEELSQLMIEGINSVNEDLSEGTFEILDGGTIVDTADDTYYLQGGSTYDETHWWGRRRYKSTNAANEWAHELNQCAAANAATSVVAGAVLGGVGAIPNGLTSAYCWSLADSVSYHNGRTNRGIVADITWVLVYSVDPQ